jgi:Protein of unknown function (DUF4054)
MATSKDVISFKARIPEFALTIDADVAAALDEADMWLDHRMWEPEDYTWAKLFLAAHTLQTAAMFTSVNAASGGAAVSSDLFVRMVAFGERRVMFGERKASTTEGQITGPGQAMLEDTIYGQKFLRLRSRNIPPILVI